MLSELCGEIYLGLISYLCSFTREPEKQRQGKVEFNVFTGGPLLRFILLPGQDMVALIIVVLSTSKNTPGTAIGGRAI